MPRKNISKQTNPQPTVDIKKYTMALEEYLSGKEFDRKQLLIANFWRGVAFSIGSVLAATIGILLLIWLLSLFGHLPFIGNFVDTLKNSVQTYN